MGIREDVDSRNAMLRREVGKELRIAAEQRGGQHQHAESPLSVRTSKPVQALGCPGAEDTPGATIDTLRPQTDLRLKSSGIEGVSNQCCFQSSAATVSGAICTLAHHATSLPCRCSC